VSKSPNWSDERPFDKTGKVLVLCPNGDIMELTIKPCYACGAPSAGGPHLDSPYFDGCKFAFGELPVVSDEDLEEAAVQQEMAEQDALERATA